MIAIEAVLSIAIPIIIFVLILSVVVFVHELGHFLAARRAGVFVEEFALGMGPKLLYVKGRPQPKTGPLEEGEDPEEATIYSIRMFPIGGFCAMRGQDDSRPDDPQSLSNKTVGQRMLVMAGGSLMNFLLAFVLFATLVLLMGYSVAEVRSLPVGSPAQVAGLQVGDRITHVNGQRVSLFENFLLQLEFSGGQPMDVRFDRDGVRHNLQITPVAVAANTYRLGFQPVRRYGLLDEVSDGYRRVGVLGTLGTAAEMMLFNIRVPFIMLARAVSGQSLPPGADVMGPIGMAGEVTQIYQAVIQQGILDTVLTMMFFAALLSTALGFFNLLPIPAMDGARLVFLAIEGIRRKPVSPERESLVHMVGFVALILLAVFIAYRDIVRLL